MQSGDRFRHAAGDWNRFGDWQPPARLQARCERLTNERRHRYEARPILRDTVFVDDGQLLDSSASEDLHRAAQSLVELIVQRRLGQDLDRDLPAAGHLHTAIDQALVSGVHSTGEPILAPDPWPR